MFLSDDIGDIEDYRGAGILEREGHELGHHNAVVAGCLVEQAAAAAQYAAEHVERHIVGVFFSDTGENHDAHLDGGLTDVEHFLLLKLGEVVGGLLG